PREMKRRLDGLRAVMADLKLDAAVFTSYHNICYFADYLYCAFGRKYALVVTPKKELLITSAIDAGQPWRRTSVETITYTDWRKDNFYHALKGGLGRAKRIGIEFDHVSLDLNRMLKEAFPKAKFADVAQPTMWMRTVKSPEEIALIKGGARVADIGGAAGFAAIKAGVPEHEVAIVATDAMVRAIARAFPHTEIRDTWCWLQSGMNTDGAHNAVTTRVIKKGDILSHNCFPMIAGYYIALERTMFCDHVTSDRHLELWEINCKVHRRGLELIRPGARCCDVAAELNEIYRSHDLLQYRSFGYGHSFGVLCHYYGREAGVELREDVKTVLKPGMVVSMEPMIAVPSQLPGAGGYKEHDILVVTETGAEDITKFPFGPEHNIVKN
ncbi:MAG: M24 family metallopeptidase, partial [Rhodospirillales bacterium]|nr:M24 family metallopeptidase [Rhodospirillales bacterium]